MGTTLLVAFLIAHGLVHLAIWLPHPDPAETAAPFAPDHSGLLVAVSVPQHTTRFLARALAVGTAVAYLFAGPGVAVGAGWAPVTAAAAAILGLLLKLVYFNPWLLLGIALDGAVLSAALGGWPVSLA